MAMRRGTCRDFELGDISYVTETGLSPASIHCSDVICHISHSQGLVTNLGMRRTSIQLSDSPLGVTVPPGDTRPHLETFLAVITGGEGEGHLHPVGSDQGSF